MELVTRKSVVKTYLEPCLKAYQAYSISACTEELSRQILNKKVKFPLLEYCAHELFKAVKEEDQIPLCDQIEALKTEGGNVLLGIILQNRLAHHFKESLQKTTEYISKADIWYVCDIIGERVYGHAILNMTDKAIPEIKQLANHPSNWVVRSLGAGIHYSIKKGLIKPKVEILFPVLLSKANNNLIKQTGFVTNKYNKNWR